jgi:fructokinase
MKNIEKLKYKKYIKGAFTMLKDNNVLCIGELLIDFICSDIDVSLLEGVNFVKKAGGAPANVAAAISKLGGKSSFVGKVGNDPFGLFMKSTLDNLAVDTSMMILDKESNTTMAFVSLKSDGERDFVFNRGADGLLKYDELDENKIRLAKIAHFGSATALLGGPTKETYLKAMELVNNENVFISFDPNYRQDLWKGNIDSFIEITRYCLKYSDFVKVSLEEVKIISKSDSLEEGVKLLHELGAKTVAVTLGSEGTYISNRKEADTIKSVKVNSIDSTGAGDAFVGAFLYKLSGFEEPKAVLEDMQQIKKITSFANIVGALVCTKLGAIAALPSIQEVENWIKMKS